MVDERKQEIQVIAQALRCTSTPCGDCEGSKCRFWQEDATPEEIRHEVGDTLGGCDRDAVGMAGADAIQELLSEVERLEEENKELLIKMEGDCGVCKFRQGHDQKCHECRAFVYHPLWEYEGLPRR